MAGRTVARHARGRRPRDGCLALESLGRGGRPSNTISSGGIGLFSVLGAVDNVDLLALVGLITVNRQTNSSANEFNGPFYPFATSPRLM